MSRHSIIARRASQRTETVLPLRVYFLWVGGALLCLLWAGGTMLPAPPPGRFDEQDSTLPPIRIHSAMKGPERVVIDTNQSLPKPPGNIVVAQSATATMDRADRD